MSLSSTLLHNSNDRTLKTEIQSFLHIKCNNDFEIKNLEDNLLDKYLDLVNVFKRMHLNRGCLNSALSGSQSYPSC